MVFFLTVGKSQNQNRKKNLQGLNREVLLQIGGGFPREQKNPVWRGCGALQETEKQDRRIHDPSHEKNHPGPRQRHFFEIAGGGNRKSLLIIPKYLK